MIHVFDAVKVDRTRSWLYAACSLSYLGAMVSSNSALQFVSYPTQVQLGGTEPSGVSVLGSMGLSRCVSVSRERLESSDREQQPLGMVGICCWRPRGGSWHRSFSGGPGGGGVDASFGAPGVFCRGVHPVPSPSCCCHLQRMLCGYLTLPFFYRSLANLVSPFQVRKLHVSLGTLGGGCLIPLTRTSPIKQLLPSL